MTRFIPLFTLVLGACIGGGSKDDTDDTGDVEACALAADSQTCPECSNGPITCTYGDESATANSCGDCQARSTLYQQLCDAGVTDDRATIEADTVCSPVACVVVYDTCNDPCEPLCVPEHQVGDVATSCDLGCADTAMPDPGECVNDGFGCAFQ